MGASHLRCSVRGMLFPRTFLFSRGAAALSVGFKPKQVVYLQGVEDGAEEGSVEEGERDEGDGVGPGALREAWVLRCWC